MSEHYPLPWFLFEGGIQRSPGIEAPNDKTVVVYGNGDGDDAGVHGETPEQARANAELIVRAVNAHDDLMRALEEIHSWLVCHSIASDSDMAASFPHMTQVAEAALQKAKQS